MSDIYISYLQFKRFRCFQNTKIRPINGVNILTGADDVGKSTVLYGTALLLSRDTSIVLMDTDYHGLNVGKGFTISATITCVDKDSNSRQKFIIRVKGTKDFKLAFDIPKTKGISDSEAEEIWDSLSKTRVIGSGLINQENFVVESAMGNPPAKSEHEQIQPAKLNLLNTAVTTPVSNQPVPRDELQAAFSNNARPNLSIESAAEMVDRTKLNDLKLIEARTRVPISMPSWGGGTKVGFHQLHAGFNQIPGSIYLIDEFALNMDYLSQRIMLDQISTSDQAFVVATTPATLKSSPNHAIIVVAPNDRIGRVEGSRIDKLITSQPDALFAKKIIIGEGATEVGLLTGLFSMVTGKLPGHSGLFICDGEGCNSALALIEQWSEDGQIAGLFIDNESNLDQEILDELIELLGDLFFQWEEGNMESNYIQAVPIEHLEEFISHPLIGPNQRLRTIAVRVGYPKDDKLNLKNLLDFIGNMQELQGLDENHKETAVYKKFYQVMLEASLGVVPNGTPDEEANKFKGHKSLWFKSLAGGFELALKLDSCGVWKNGLYKPLLPIINAYLVESGFPEISDLPSSIHSSDDIRAIYLSRPDLM